jgi:hypothetical protein
MITALNEIKQARNDMTSLLRKSGGEIDTLIRATIALQRDAVVQEAIGTTVTARWYSNHTKSEADGKLYQEINKIFKETMTLATMAWATTHPGDILAESILRGVEPKSDQRCMCDP